MLDHTSNL
jgi:hypothetical protein